MAGVLLYTSNHKEQSCGWRNMAAGKDKRIVDVNEFEKIREQVIKDEIGADWKLAKSFEHTTVYRRTDTDNRDSIFKVSSYQSLPCNTLHDKL